MNRQPAPGAVRLAGAAHPPRGVRGYRRRTGGARQQDPGGAPDAQRDHADDPDHHRLGRLEGRGQRPLHVRRHRHPTTIVPSVTIDAITCIAARRLQPRPGQPHPGQHGLVVYDGPVQPDQRRPARHRRHAGQDRDNRTAAARPAHAAADGRLRSLRRSHAHGRQPQAGRRADGRDAPVVMTRQTAATFGLRGAPSWSYPALSWRRPAWSFRSPSWQGCVVPVDPTSSFWGMNPGVLTADLQFRKSRPGARTGRMG